MNSRISAANALKEFVVLVWGLSTAMCVAIVFVNSNSFNLGLNINHISALIICIVLLFRFSFGNFRIVDERYIIGNNESFSIAIDLIGIVSLSMLLMIISASVNTGAIFKYCIILLLIVDIIWIIFSQKLASDHESSVQKRWLINNFVFILLLGAVLHLYENLSHFFYESKIVVDLIFYFFALINSIIDFYISRKFYFPSDS